MASSTDRSEYIAGLRALADILDADETLPLPYAGEKHSRMSIFTHDREALVAWARAIPGTLDKSVDEGSSWFGFELRGAIRGLHVVVYGNREQVCKRIVTGEHEVTEEVPDPEVLATVPKITVTKTVEDVEWVCEPFLAEVGEAS